LIGRKDSAAVILRGVRLKMSKTRRNSMSDIEPPPANTMSNVPEFSVGDLAQSLKRTIEDNFGRVRVRGELSRVSIAGSGHMYSNLKDDNAVIDAVCWKGTMAKLPIRPEEGMEVICTGRISTYPQRSNYQLIIESMELAGEGALLKMLEERKKKLGAEGLFEESRKKRLPFLPQKIGVVTSPTGAVIRDILHRLADRFPRDVLIWPVLVQGDGAAKQVSNAVRGFNALPDDHKPDLLIVARGGGSLEDLMPFNEENVVRAVAESVIPVISAVGHETDTTLCDFAADLRAPTPTGAAEMAVPVKAQLMAQISEDESRLRGAMARMVEDRRMRLETQAAKLGDPSRLLEAQQQRVDHVSSRLGSAYDKMLGVKRERLISGSARLRHPQNRIDEMRKTLGYHGDALTRIAPRLLSPKQDRLGAAARMLESLSYENILRRGYAVVKTADGQLISAPDAVSQGQALAIQFADHKVLNVVAGGQAPEQAQPKSPPTKRPPKTKSTLDQTSLFD
jgi:exodeoxyribonuclease VII large subunit